MVSLTQAKLCPNKSGEGLQIKMEVAIAVDASLDQRWSYCDGERKFGGARARKYQKLRDMTSRMSFLNAKVGSEVAYLGS